MSYVYRQIQAERDAQIGIWEVGYYAPDGIWERESKHYIKDAAAARVRY